MLILNLIICLLMSALYSAHHHNETSKSTNHHHHPNHKKDHKDHSNINDNKNYKKVKLTYYWITKESLFPEGKDKEIKACSSDGEKSDKVISKVSSEFYESLHTEGTGKLRDGKFVNCGNDDCTCFNKVPGPQGNKGDILNIYTSVASKSLKVGTKIYIKELDGFKLPSEETHNGCVKVEDTGYGLERDQIDLFSYYKANYERVNKGLRLESVKVKIDSNCKVKAYSSKIC